VTPDDHSLAWRIGLGDSTTADVLPTSGLGALAAVILPWVVRGCAAVRSGLARAVLATDPTA